MARFKYLGELPKPFVKSFGKCQLIKLKQKSPGYFLINPPGGQDHFVIGEDIGVDITDEVTLLYLRADKRFEEIK